MDLIAVLLLFAAALLTGVEAARERSLGWAGVCCLAAALLVGALPGIG